MKENILWIVILVIAIGLFGYFYMNRDSDSTSGEVNNILSFTKSSTVSEVMNNKSFEGFGNLIFPVDRDFDGNTRLDDIDDIYVWYNYINDDKMVEIVNYMKNEVDAGNQIFYHIYSEDEIKADSEKRNTGIFYFRGEPGNKMAILNAGGGETLSLVLDNNADLYDGALMVSSQWDGGYEDVVNSRVPLYFFIGEDDDYYGSGNFKETYQKLHDLYIDEGLSDDEIDNILVLDVRDADYFEEHGFSSQHAGGGNVAHEEDIMRWLLTK